MSQVEHHQSGVGYWRSLEQLAETPQVQELLSQEFPGYDPKSMLSAGGASRRRFLKLMGASMAMAGLTLTGCRRWPKEHLAPYSTNPSGAMPGVPEQYATAWELGGVAQPLLVTSYDGRPIKVDGNPSHPCSWTVKGKLGSADGFAQASILEMYDPERSRELIDRSTGKAKKWNWEGFSEAATAHFGKMKGNGAGFAILSEATTSPSVLDMKKRLLAVYPQAKWYEYEPLSNDAELEGSRQAFGKALRTRLHLDKADVVVLFDADVLYSHPAHVRYAGDWAEKRRSGDRGEMNRVYIAESRFSITGTVADHRLPVDPGRIDPLIRALAKRLGAAGGADETLTKEEEAFIGRAAADLKAAGGNGLVAAGPSASAAASALSHVINQQLGAFGKTVTFIDDPAGDRPTHFAAITDLSKQMAAGKIDTLLILGGNPAYDAPIDTDFANALKSVKSTIRLGLYDDETSRLCKWHIPRAHYLESWGDARAWDGSVGVVQPLIMPLFGGKSVIEVLAMIAGDKETAGDQIVRRTWKEQFVKGAEFERDFRRILEAGVLENSQWPAVQATAKPGEFPTVAQPAKGTFYLKFEPDSHVYDGRFANNGWLQETPDPLTKMVWDNAAMISVKDAQAMGDLKTGDVLKLKLPGNGPWMEAAAYVLPGQPIGVISLSLGYGRTASGAIGDKLGFNAYTVRTSANPYVVSGVQVTTTSQTYVLASTILHHLIDKVGMDGREERVGGKGQSGVLLREATLAQYKKNPRAPHVGFEGAARLQLFNPPHKFNETHAWGMTIDLNTCIGCNACAVACQAENNVPVVGKDQVLMHRMMAWLRLDIYFKGDANDPQIDVIHQPMMCQHCENAPCEQVCPVGATMHDTEGLNTMVYNRCVGTRYCSNNCPYKVRRFNYFDWHAKPPRNSTGVLYPGFPDEQQNDVDKIRRMQFNPEVTVRMRGVMEKCTYCTHRIARAKINTRNAGTDVKDGDIITACQQACPTQAITFGNLNEKTAAVVALQKSNRAYDVLGDLDTRPRTRFLAKLRNPSDNAGVAGNGGKGGEHADANADRRDAYADQDEKGAVAPQSESVGQAES